MANTITIIRTKLYKRLIFESLLKGNYEQPQIDQVPVKEYHCPQWHKYTQFLFDPKNIQAPWEHWCSLTFNITGKHMIHSVWGLGRLVAAIESSCKQKSVSRNGHKHSEGRNVSYTWLSTACHRPYQYKTMEKSLSQGTHSFVHEMDI